MAYTPFRNLGLKCLSIAIAALLWLVVAGERVVERIVRAPVEFLNLPAGLEIVGSPPDSVAVRVRGSSGALARVGPGEMAAMLDLSGVRPGRRLLQLTPGHVTAPYGVEVVQVGPSTLTMEFEASAVRTIPVKASVEGRPAHGYTIMRVIVEPSSVEVAGPGGALDRVAAAVTEPVLVSDRTSTVRETVNIGVPDASVRLKAPQTATVTVVIASVKDR
jgi:hypothetical protein